MPLASVETRVGVGHPAQCSCPNCDEFVSRFSECGICFEPLQSIGSRQKADSRASGGSHVIRRYRQMSDNTNPFHIWSSITEHGGRERMRRKARRRPGACREFQLSLKFLVKFFRYPLDEWAPQSARRGRR
ncbi:hypothetical protein EVAR_102388_1 [Eumeta japonica]|uniref:Uncharacterized protein n=1 Tax=Eumeta variegata TaxID=151549 RepID=A0A4C1YNE1_EUMVA|nr:hypothetical protein EVAR_102388_1 [Eumeta japonica]